MTRDFIKSSRHGSSRGLLVAAIAALVASGCKQGGGEFELPPAKGQNAAPLPQLPNLGEGGGDVIAGSDDPNRTTGTLHPRATANVAAKAGGVLTRIAVREGDEVVKGAFLFRVDASGATLQRNQAAVALEAAQVQLDAVKVEYDRAVRLREQNALTPAAFDQIAARYQAAQVAVEQANVGLSIARKMLADTTVRAPIAGTVTRRNLDVGDTVSTMPPTVVLQVQDQRVLELHFTLPESALGKVRAGTEVQAVFASEPEPRVLTVDRVDPVVDPISRTLTAVALIDNEGGALRPGMLAEITVGAKPGDQAGGEAGGDGSVPDAPEAAPETAPNQAPKGEAAPAKAAPAPAGAGAGR